MCLLQGQVFLLRRQMRDLESQAEAARSSHRALPPPDASGSYDGRYPPGAQPDRRMLCRVGTTSCSAAAMVGTCTAMGAMLGGSAIAYAAQVGLTIDGLSVSFEHRLC